MYKRLNSFENILPKGCRGARYTSLLSCYDFRTEYGKYGVSKQALQRIISRLARLPEEYYSHIRDVRVFGFKTLVLEVKLRSLVSQGSEYDLRFLASKFPFPSYISSIALSMDGRVFVAYSVPEELYRIIYEEVSKLNDVLELHTGVTLPVRNCYGGLGLSKDLLSYGESEFERTIKPPPKIRGHILDYIIVAILDRNPLTTLNRMKNLVLLLGSENIELRYRYLLKHYRILSGAGVVGRVRVSSVYWGRCIPVMVSGEPSLAPKLYAIASAVLASSRMFLGDEKLYISMAIPLEVFNDVVKLIPREASITLIRDSAKGIFPYNYYDPYRRRWGFESVNVVDALRRHRLVR